MENNNKKLFKNKSFNSIKEENDNNRNYIKTEISNIGCSMSSLSEVNNLIWKDGAKENEYPGSLNELFGNYLKSPRKIFDIKNNSILKKLSLLKILKERESNFEWELYDYFDFYQTIVYFKEGRYTPNINQYKECRLVIKEQYLYILNKYNNRTNLMEIPVNPDNSFLLRIENNNFIKDIDKKFLKYDYDISKPILCLNFDFLTCILLINKINLNEFSIKILGTNKNYSFIIENKKVKEKFCYILGNLIANSYGNKNNLLNLVLNHKNFNLKTYMTPELFEYFAKTGDIILFKTRHILADIQRFFTCDNYDHIAFIQSNYGFITIFDASKKGKCKSHYWGSFRASSNHLAFKKICYRRLNIEEKNYEKKQKIQERIEKLTVEFMNEMQDKKYYLSFFNIFFKGKPRNYEIKGEWDKAEGFSCSSLVAALYLKLGIIKLNNTVHSIKPGDFEQNRNLSFLPGFSLGPEKIIEFSN